MPRRNGTKKINYNNRGKNRGRLKKLRDNLEYMEELPVEVS